MGYRGNEEQGYRSYRVVTMSDDYTQGWMDADEAIRYNLPGCNDYSQGLTDWDKGWNARMDIKRNIVWVE